MIIIQDKGQQEGKHEEKNQYWNEHGIEILNAPLPVGDYILGNNQVMDVIFRKDKRGVSVKKMDFLGTYDVTVDTKKDIQELIGNVCGKQHARFRDECILAKNNNIKLYILIQNLDGVTCIDDLKFWENPRRKIMKNSAEIIGTWKNGKPKYKRVPKYPSATNGETLMKACKTMQEKYGVKFVFCHNSEQGYMVLNLLGMGD